MAHLPNKSELFDPRQFSEEQHFLIAYSGGSDSTALLHFCAHHPELKSRIRAIHINHQLQTEADEWQKHCQNQCSLWDIECVVERVNLKDDSENTARNARRSAFKKHLHNNETLLTAHHQQDQIETVLFRLFRGTGVKGLGGIKKDSYLSTKQFINRPLLGLTKVHITTYLHEHQLDWVLDPSNKKDKYSRNFIRNRLLPEISAYSPKAQYMIGSTAEHLQNSHELLMRLMPNDNPLALDEKVDATFLHHWLQKKNVSIPTTQQLNNFLNSTKQAAHHKHPSLKWDSQYLMAWQSYIYLLKSITTLKNTKVKYHKHIPLPCGGSLQFSHDLPLDDLLICYGVLGERLKMAQHKHHKTIKKLHQEHNTPPWIKTVTPFIYHNDQLLAVGDWQRETFKQLLEVNNCQYSWQKPEQIL